MAGFASTELGSLSDSERASSSPLSLRAKVVSSGVAGGHIVVLTVAFAVGIVAQGAYYPAGQRVVAALLVVAVVVAARVRGWRLAEFRGGIVLAAIAVSSWVVIRAWLAGDPGAAGGAVALLAGVVVVVMVCRRATAAERAALGDIVVAVTVLAALAAWAGVAWRLSRWAIEEPGVWRGSGTLSYANATAGLLVPVVLLAVCRGAARPAGVLNPLACCVLLTGLGATLSRGGLLALAAGTLTAVVVVGGRRFVMVAAAPAAGALVALAGLAPSFATDSSPRPVLAVASLAGGLILTWWCASRPTRAAWAGAGVGAIGAVAIVAVAVTASNGAFDAGRLSISSPDRVGSMTAAVEVAAQHPFIGAGPGAATFRWHDVEYGVLDARYAHNEYLQFLAEYGAVGLALVAALLVAISASVWRGATDARTLGVRAGVAAGLVALGVHSALDFLWHVPIIPLTAALLVGLVTPIHKEESWSDAAVST